MPQDIALCVPSLAELAVSPIWRAILLNLSANLCLLGISSLLQETLGVSLGGLLIAQVSPLVMVGASVYLTVALKGKGHTESNRNEERSDEAASARSGNKVKAAENGGEGEYRVIEEYWDTTTGRWEQETTSEDAVETVSHLFTVRKRSRASNRNHRMYHGRSRTSGVITNDSDTVVILHSKTLSSALRCTMKDNDAIFSPSPEIAAKEVYLVRSDIEKLVNFLDSEEGSRKEDVVLAASVKDHLADGAQAKARRELGVLLGWLEKDFAEIDTQLQRLKSAGQISYKLLWALFFPKLEAVARHSPSGHHVGFSVQSTEYHQENGFVIAGSYLLYDGEKWRKAYCSETIPEFRGLRDVAGLSVRPITGKEKELFTTRGEIASRRAGVSHLTYQGTIHFTAQKKAYVDGRVVIDMVMYRQRQPNFEDSDWEARDRLGVGLSVEDEAGSCRYWCYSPTLCGYSLKLKEWGEFHVLDLDDIIFDKNAFDDLVLDAAQKELIKGLVEVAKTDSKNNIVQDLIASKGGGVVACLHGSAGCGKTLTAEAVAEMLERPLISIGSGQLGIHEHEVEKVLTETLELADKWDAVVLIDEADVYCEARDIMQIQRNALVSVFLRALDYSRSVLFLTTNRVNTFDPAFVSRFNIAVKYPDLDKHSRFAIWSRFLGRTGAYLTNSTSSPITKVELNRLADRPMNGRTIRNCVKTAQALAFSRKEPLAIRHVETVVRVSEDFAKDFKDADIQGVYSAKGEGIYHRPGLYN